MAIRDFSTGLVYVRVRGMEEKRRPGDSSGSGVASTMSYSSPHQSHSGLKSVGIRIGSGREVR